MHNGRDGKPSFWVISGQEFDRAQPVRLIASMAPERPCDSFSSSTDLSVSRLPVPKLAVQGRYNMGVFSSVPPVPYRALQSDRCLVITT